jgi:AcrR family transcriptional regulator
MDRINSAVKARRHYDSSRRRRQALLTRQTVLDVAARLLLNRGYAATTIASIAEEADVSVETIYKAFRGKPGLVRAMWEQGLQGAGPIPTYRRSDEMRMRETDPRAVIEKWGTFTTEVAPRLAPILLLIRTAAAIDPEMATLREEVLQEQLSRMEHNARHLYERGDLREGVSLTQARDVMLVYSSPELYELLVLRQAWQLDRYGQFVAQGMIAALLPSPPGV